MNANFSVFVIRVEAIVYLLLHNLHDCNFQVKKCLRFNIILKLKTIHGRTHYNKIKSRVDDSYLFQSLYTHKVAEAKIKDFSVELFLRIVLTLELRILTGRVKDTDWEKAPSNKTQALAKRTSMGIWVVATLRQLFIRGF